MAILLKTAVSAQTANAHQDVPFPALHVVVAIDPQSVSPDGDLRYAWRVHVRPRPTPTRRHRRSWRKGGPPSSFPSSTWPARAR